MKKVFFLISAILLLAISCAKENKPTDQNDSTDIVNTYIDINSITFKKVDLQGVNTLALASPGASSNKVPRTKADGEACSYLLYKVDENGILTEIEYTIIIESRTIVENPGADSTAVATEEVVAYDSIKANLKLAMEYVYTIGTKWLWLYNCSYYCEDLETIENEQAREAVSRIIFEFGSGHSFLVRRTDGALFSWDGVSNPASEYYYALDKPWGRESHPSQAYVDATVISRGEDIFICQCVNKEYDLYSLYFIKDDGDILEVNQLLNDGVSVTGGIVFIPGEDAIYLRLSHVEGKGVILFMNTGKLSIISTEKLAEDAEPISKGFVEKADGLHGLFYSNLNLQEAQSHNGYFLILESSGKKVRIKNVNDHEFFILTLDEEETITLHSSSIDFSLQATEEDPMCLHATKPKNDGPRGVSLPAGEYYVHLTGNYSRGDFYMYIDEMNNVTHEVGPWCYIHPLNVDMSAQTASWGEKEWRYMGEIPEIETGLCYSNPHSWWFFPGGTPLFCTVDFDNYYYSIRERNLPDGFPRSGYINGYAYKFSAEDKALYVYCLETLECETVPVIMDELPENIVNNVVWIFDSTRMCFCAEIITLEGSFFTIYIPVIGENRGVARMEGYTATGAGNISQLLRLN